MTPKLPPCFAGRTTTTRRVRYSVMAAVAALAGLVLPLAAQTTPAVAAGPCGPPVVNPVACENTKPGDPASDWQVDRLRRHDDPGLRHDDERERRARRSSSRSRRRRRSYHIDIYRLGYYGGDGARKIAAGIQPTAYAAADPARLPDRRPATGLVDCGNWARVGVVDRAEHRGVGRLHRAPGARRHRRRQPDLVRRARTTPATRTSSSRPPTRPGRPTTATAATASTVHGRLPARQPGRTRAPTRSPTTGRSTPPTTTAAGRELR